MRRPGILGALVASLLAAAFALAAPPSSPAKGRAVDLSGRWVLDLARSDFGPGAKSTPRWRRDVIVHRGPHVHVRPQVVKIDGDTTRMEYSYRTDGREAVNQVLGQPVRTVGSWKGDTLELVSKVRVMTSTFRMTERWSLANARRSLVIERESESPLGKRRSRMVYRKE